MKSLSNLSETLLADVMPTIEDYLQTWNDKAVPAMMALFAEESEFTDVMGQIARGKASITRMHDFIFQKMMKNAVLTLDDLYLREIAGGMIMITGKWTTEGHTDPAGKTLPKRNGIIQFICINQDGEWKIKLIYNTDLSRLYTNIDDYKMSYYQ